MNAAVQDLRRASHPSILVLSPHGSVRPVDKDDFYMLIADRARAVQESYEDRQLSTQNALNELLAEIEKNERRKKEQAKKRFDGLAFFVYRTLLDAGVENAEEASGQIKAAFTSHPNWLTSEAELRELR